MSGFEASDGALRDAASQLSSTGDELDHDFVPVRAQIDALVSGAWSGGAARGFRAGWQDWLDGYEQAMAGLRSMAALLTSTGADYGRAESDSTAVVSGLER